MNYDWLIEQWWATAAERSRSTSAFIRGAAWAYSNCAYELRQLAAFEEVMPPDREIAVRTGANPAPVKAGVTHPATNTSLRGDR
jgi:hypothetical protein